jgi:hypothetical protein
MLPVLILIHSTANVSQIRTAIKEPGMVAKRMKPGCCYLRGNSLDQCIVLCLLLEAPAKALISRASHLEKL